LLKETSSRRRPYGTGSLFVHRDAWYGKWYVGGRQVKRKVGARRSSPRNNGLTKAEAERELRRLMRVTRATPLERLTLREAGDAYIAHLRDFLERKPSTVQDYECILGKAERILSRKFVDTYLVNDIDGYIRNAKAEGRSTKTICNHLIFLQGLFGFAVKRGWAQSNPVAAIEQPRVSGSNPDIRCIDQNELRVAPGRADRAALARHRHRCRRDPGQAQLYPRAARHAQVTAIKPGGADAAPSSRLARISR
jgi:Phage integrase, N-terminal SAM-like domain